VCRLRSVCRSVFLHGGSGRNDVAFGRRELHFGNRSSFKGSGCGGAVPSAASARSPSVAGSDAPPRALLR
jgi:hypothetical protein